MSTTRSLEEYQQLTKTHLNAIYQMQVNLAQRKDIFADIAEDKIAIIREHQINTRVFALKVWIDWAKKNPTIMDIFSNPAYVTDEWVEPSIKDEALRTELIKLKAIVPNIRGNKDLTHGRSFSKYRMSAGPLLTVDGKPFFAILGCAINLMGSSPTDEEKYTQKIEKQTKLALNEASYRADTKKIVDLIFQICQHYGKKELVMPDFGIGVYLKTLEEKTHQEKAKKIMRDIFAELANHYGINVTWVIWKNLPDAKDTCDTLNQTYKSSNLTFVYDDFLTKIDQSKEDQAILIPGSDASTGGRFYSNENTLEEQIAKHTTLVETRSVCFNDSLKQEYKKILSSSDTLKEDKTNAAEKMQALITALKGKTNASSLTKFTSPSKRIIFNNKEEAENFVNFCASQEKLHLEGDKKPLPKPILFYQPQKDVQKHIVVLEKDEFAQESIKKYLSECKAHCEQNVLCIATFDDKAKANQFLADYNLDQCKPTYTATYPSMFNEKQLISIYLDQEELLRIEAILIDSTLKLDMMR